MDDLIRNYIWSAIRTGVALLISGVIGWATENFGPLIDEGTKAQISGALYLVAAGLYYLIARALEQWVSPKFSFLVGDFRQGNTAPVYPAKTETTVVPPAVEGN